MNNLELARWYMALLGVALVVAGLAAFVDNPIVGPPSDVEPVFHIGGAHSIVLIASGGIGLFIAFGLAGSALSGATIGFGAAYLLLFGLTVASPNLLGIFDVPVNLADHVLHAGVGTVTVIIGWLARNARKVTDDDARIPLDKQQGALS
jgi:hypothetical protein